jgi:hypothetical protein
MSHKTFESDIDSDKTIITANEHTQKHKIPCRTLVPTEKRLYHKSLSEYRKNFKTYLMTSRFNNNTWQENQQFRKSHPNFGCIYCSPDPISSQIPNDSIMFILEMNNDQNRIMGIGMVRKHSILGRYFVYENGNYNRYVFIGKNRIDRKEMTEEEERIMSVFDILCFTGNKHLKRGQGLKTFPIDMLYRMEPVLDLVKFIGQMFKSRISKKQFPNQNV